MLLIVRSEWVDSSAAILYKVVFYDDLTVKGNVIYTCLGLAFYGHQVTSWVITPPCITFAGLQCIIIVTAVSPPYADCNLDRSACSVCDCDAHIYIPFWIEYSMSWLPIV